MIVRCANCHTEFSLEDQQIGPEGATVRCSVCGYVFPVEPPPGVGDLPWQVRTVEDLLFTAPDLATLRAWIAEGRLHPDDQVSRTGRHWLRLGDMPEFSTVFSGFSDLPPVFEALDEPDTESEADGDTDGSALAELGPPPSFAGEMPVVQGVDTDILVVDSPLALMTDTGVTVVSSKAAVERDHPASGPSATPSAEDSSLSLPPPPGRPSSRVAPSVAESSGPMPFPLAELDVDPDEPEPERMPGPDADPVMEEVADESAVRMRPRPRPYAPTAPVASIPDVPIADFDDDDSDDELPAGVPTRQRQSTSLYGHESSGPSSMLDVVTHRVDEEAALVDSAEVDTSSAAEERVPIRPREPSGGRKAGVPVGSSRRSSGSVPIRISGASPAAVADSEPQPTPVVDDDPPPARRSSWPLVAGLGLVAGAAVVFGVPSIRARVLDVAGTLVGGEEPFDPSTLEELGPAKAAMRSLDPAAMGAAEAALQGRIDGGDVPPSGVAAMKLLQVELLATRSIERKIGAAAGSKATHAGPDDVERAARILAGVVVDDVADRAHMRRVRARLRLAQGRPETEILPLLPDGGDQDLQRLVAAAPLWQDVSAAVPEGVIAGLTTSGSDEALSALALALAYLRAGDDAKAATIANNVLAEVPGQPTAIAIVAKAGGQVPAAVGDDASSGTNDDGSGGAGTGSDSADADDGDDTDELIVEDDDEPAVARARPVSVDKLIERGCDLVESGKASEGLVVLRKARSRRPADLDAQICIGLAYNKQGDTRKALGAFEAILKRAPSFAPAVRNAARAAAKLGQTEKAVGHYRKLLSLRPGDATALAYVEKNG